MRLRLLVPRQQILVVVVRVKEGKGGGRRGDEAVCEEEDGYKLAESKIVATSGCSDNDGP